MLKVYHCPAAFSTELNRRPVSPWNQAPQKSCSLGRNCWNETAMPLQLQAGRSAQARRRT